MNARGTLATVYESEGSVQHGPLQTDGYRLIAYKGV